MYIPRNDLLTNLEGFAFSGNGVVIGAPGVGKTYSLKELTAVLLEKGTSCLYLPIDKLGVDSEASLKSEIGIKDDFINYLDNQNTTQGIGVLIIDAFDAARSEVAQKFYLSLIRRVINKLKGRWNVIVSVRTYDARKSEDLQDLFPRGIDNLPSKEFQMEDIHCRHFFIPKLNDDEVQEATISIPHLDGFYKRGSAEFRELLRVPFNLWLLEKLLSLNPNISELSVVNSEVQLLGLFWKQRVTDGVQNDDKRAVLSRVVGRMVEQCSLSVRKDEVYDIGASAVWSALLSEEILSERTTTAQRVTFSHNILFDYAVSVLLIEDEPENAIKFIIEDLSRPLFLRPSLNYHFTRLWYDAPDLFWKSFLYFLPSSITHLRLFARLIPTTVIAYEARRIEQLQPILNLLYEKQPIANEAILRLLQSLRALQVVRDKLWVCFFDSIAGYLQPDFAWDLVILTSEILERAQESENKEVIKSCGQISRRLFEWIWQKRKEDKKPWFDNLGGRWVVPLVSKTFWTDPSASRTLLENVLKLTEEENFPIDYLYQLSHEIDKIWPFDPDFVASIYESVFTHYEISEEKTNMGTPVLPLSSTRRQDYHMCQYSLIKHFPKYLRTAPSFALPAIINCLNFFIISRHIIGYLKEGIKLDVLTEEFPFRGKVARCMQDSSYMWDVSEHQDEPIEMADELFKYITEIASSEAQSEILDSMFDIFCDNVWVAFFWRRLLRTASQIPDVFSNRIFELCIARPIQKGPETIHELGMFLESAAPTFTREQIMQIEKTVIDLPEGETNIKRKESLEHLRDRLLARIPVDLLQTEAAKRIREEMTKADKIPANEPVATFTSWSGPYTTEKWLKEQGADLDAPENQALQKFFDPLDKFTSEWQNKTPDENSINSILPLLRETYDDLKRYVHADKPVLNATWTKLASCVEAISKECPDPESDAFKFCREVLLLCSEHEEPEPDPEYDSKFDSPHWSPAPRNEAAQGLPWLAIRKPDKEIMIAIKKLVSDPVPSVRWLVIVEIWRLYTKTPKEFWLLAEYVAEHENNRTVQDALCRSLSYIISREEKKSVSILKKLIERTLMSDEESDFLNSIVSLLMWLVISQENTWAIDTVDKFLKDPVKFSKALKRAVFDALSYVRPTYLDSSEKSENSDRSIRWLLRSIDTAKEGVKSIQSIHDYQSNEEILSKLRDIYGVIDEIVMRIYFAANVRDKSGGKNESNMSDEQRKVFYFKIKPLLEKVLTFALDEKSGMMFAPTAHHFVQLLNGILRYDPQGVLHLAAGVAKASEPFGYNIDSMAVGEVVKLVEAILADFRDKVRDGDSLQDLLDLLDIFAKTGWPDALRLVWRLDEVFR